MVIYCHFSFRRRENNSYGLFAVAMYRDFEGTKCLMHITRKEDLWVPDDCYVTAIQGYAHALKTISQSQGLLKTRGIDKIYLVCDNQALVKWICEPKKAKERAAYMEKAVEDYRTGGISEITIPVGCCNPVRSEKSYKYCLDKYVVDLEKNKSVKEADGVRRLDFSGSSLSTLKSVEASNLAKPIISGIKEC